MFGRTVGFVTDTGTVSVWVLCSPNDSDEKVAELARQKIKNALENALENGRVIF